MSGYPTHDACGGLMMLPAAVGMPMPRGASGVVYCTTCFPRAGFIVPGRLTFERVRDASRAAGVVDVPGELGAGHLGPAGRLALHHAICGNLTAARRKRSTFALLKALLLVDAEGEPTEEGRALAARIGLSADTPPRPASIEQHVLPIDLSYRKPPPNGIRLLVTIPPQPSVLTPPPAPAVDAFAATKPLIKWAGGKGKLLNGILPALPATFGRYFEPFAGGLALFFRLQPRGAYLADANKHLVRIYRAVRDHADDVIAALQEHKNDRAYYDRIRDDFNDGYGDDIWRAAALMYMNRAGFNGVCRFNGDGKYNVPFGDGKPKTLCDVENIRACSALLQQSTLEWADFRAVENVAQAGDLVFLDSPYLPENAGSFVNYTKEGFSAQDHEDVAALFRRLVARGVHALASNSDTPRARELYAGFEIRTLCRSNSVNSKASARGGKAEILVLGGTWTPRGAS